MFHRPPTSRPRGICVYYNTPRGCFAGNNCKFLHGNVQEISPYDQNKICRYYEAGYCKRGDQCWFRHATPQMPQLHESDDEELGCSICMEKPTVFGLLTGCSHVFCLSCLKKWRDPTGRSSEYLDSNSGMHKRCPMCRGPSRFVTPSHVFYKNEDPKKEEVLENYKKSMKRVKCKYFERSIPGLRFCPYGRDCFYKHEDENGQEYVFQKGVDHYMNIYRHRMQRKALRRAAESYTGQEEVPPEMQMHVASLMTEVNRLRSTAFPGADEADRRAIAEMVSRVGSLVTGLLSFTGDNALSDDEADDDAEEEDEFRDSLDFLLNVSQSPSIIPFQPDSQPQPPLTTDVVIGPSDSTPSSPHHSIYPDFFVGDPSHRGESQASEAETDASEDELIFPPWFLNGQWNDDNLDPRPRRIRQNWEDESEDELLLRSSPCRTTTVTSGASPEAIISSVTPVARTERHSPVLGPIPNTDPALIALSPISPSRPVSMDTEMQALIESIDCTLSRDSRGTMGFRSPGSQDSTSSSASSSPTSSENGGSPSYAHRRRVSVAEAVLHRPSMQLPADQPKEAQSSTVEGRIA